MNAECGKNLSKIYDTPEPDSLSIEKRNHKEVKTEYLSVCQLNVIICVIHILLFMTNRNASHN